MLVRWLAQKSCVVLLALAVSGCGTNPLKYTPCEVEKRVSISGVEFDSSIKYIGPTIRSAGKRSAAQDIQFARLYAERSKRTDELSFYVQVDIEYAEGWRYYRSASFSDATRTSVQTQWFQEESCSYQGCLKKYSARVPVNLQQLLNSPQLRFRLESITGETNVFTIPRNHVEGFIQATGVNTGKKCVV